METFINLGPVVDMAVVDLDRQGQGQVSVYLEGYSLFIHIFMLFVNVSNKILIQF